MKAGRIGEAEFRRWPLELGWQHLRTVLPQGTKHANFMAKYHARKRSVELVIPYCKETVERISDWFQPAFTRFTKSHLVVTVVMKCGDDAKMRQVPLKVFNHTKAVRFLEIQDEDVRGDECSGYNNENLIKFNLDIFEERCEY